MGFDREAFTTIADTLNPEEVAAQEAAGAHPGELFRALLDTGLAELVIAGAPGSGDRWAFCSAISDLAQRWVGLAESIHYQVLSICAFAESGSPDQHSRYLEAMCRGRLIASNCFNEAGAGSDLAAMRTSARRTDDGDYVLDGTKQWIGHAQIADLLFVYAKTADRGLRGITCFLVDAHAPGITVTHRPKTTGAGSLPSGDIRFDSVTLPADSVVGRVNRGMLAGESLFTQGRLGVASCAVGLARAAMGRAGAYAAEHHQFGSPIIDFQGVAFPLAEISTDIAASAALLRAACAAVEDQRPDAQVLAAQAKLHATRTARRATDTAIGTLGSRAFDAAEPVLRWASEAHLLEVVQGTPQIQKIAIAAQLR
ncbi:acyl-CoA dehydrogenase [Nocardia sp. BSTN01]|uniref:acyl-CoA dehydrogenase family protein n=1 Tax=Nocardia sp. BSTN01 TaxID=2783665 RepID=UPI0018905882|nr:acyl-CoA dehydrogenase [Nocardia sp. BSTN01]MBF5000860.1 acyl-CoA dehydrogenase [Nocardia sp. BSTN01]